MELREPKRKRVGPHIKPRQPFPIWIESESEIPEGLWPMYFGTFTGDCVVLSNPEEITSLYNMGFFGKGSFSRGYPSFGLTKKGIPAVIKERQWLRRKSWMDKMKANLSKTLSAKFSESGEGDSGSNLERKSKQPDKSERLCSNNDRMEVDVSDENQSLNTCETGVDQSLDISVASGSNFKSDCDVSEQQSGKPADCKVAYPDNSENILVLADSDEDDIEKVIHNPLPHLEDEEIKTVEETLNLTFEEAFFLSYALGCLQVINMSCEHMTLNQLWNTFVEIKADFIESYVAYHYFRAKGWVVKSGYKFGGDFLLYKQGPPFYHASYIVLVQKVDQKLSQQRDSMTWTKLHGLNRLADTSGKDIITCQVLFPDSLSSEDLKTPKSLPKFQVNELLMKRWVPSQERVEKNDS